MLSYNIEIMVHSNNGNAIVALVTLLVFGNVIGVEICPVGKPCYCHERSQNGITVLDVVCIGQNLQRIPDITWTVRPKNVRVESLKLSMNNIKTLLNDSLQVLSPRLIDISENGLETIELGAFSGLENRLEILDVSSNDGLEFPKVLISTLRRLKYLDMSGNFATTDYHEYFEIEKFPHSDSLETLTLKDCSIMNLGDDIFEHLVNLQELDLSINQFESIPSALKKCRHLKKLDLNKNYIEELNDDFFKDLNELEWLSLRYNEIIQESFTDRTFRGLEHSLRYLSLTETDISEVPKASLQILKKLEHLEICDTSIKYIKEGDFNVPSPIAKISLCEYSRGLTLKKNAFLGMEKTLKYLSLHATGLKRVPNSALTGLKNLETLDLSGNKIVRITKRDFAKLDALKSLTLQLNRNTTFTYDSLKHLSGSLKELYLQNMQLKSIPSAVRHLTSLVALDISHNPFERIGEDFFNGLSATKYVINSCMIKTVSSLAFINLKKRIGRKIKVDLRHNQIENLHFVTSTSVFSEVIVSNNEIDCSCHELAVSKCDNIVIRGKCFTPKIIAGEEIGGKAFVTELTKECNTTLAGHKHCPKKNHPSVSCKRGNGQKCNTAAYSIDSDDDSKAAVLSHYVPFYLSALAFAVILTKIIV